VDERVFTKEDAKPFLKKLEEAGFSPTLIGSVARLGKSDNDIDILIECKNWEPFESLLDNELLEILETCPEEIINTIECDEVGPIIYDGGGPSSFACKKGDKVLDFWMAIADHDVEYD